ncbi:MAG: M20 family metallo-hydrolase [Candidatus Solibacter usitatus]|nr:M20 family metallo-hydrolase [Candidatus Solibacter usitatus]
MNLTIDSVRLTRELEQLASYSDTPAPSVTRVVFSPADLAARAYVKSLCGDAGLTLREDAVGNTFARWQGSEPHAAVGTGSHIDAIPHAGRYDGTVGVLGGLEAIRALQRARFHPRRSVELLLFTSEEPTRFGIGCLGSRLLSGSLTAAAGGTLRDMGGATLDEVRATAGFSGPLESVRLPPGYYSSFVELHIEQGPLLERVNMPIGVVTAIAAPASVRLWIEGEGGHAGAVLMPQRRDAFLAAAEIALEVENAARSTGFIDTVATSGVCDVFPGAINSIPSKVKIEFDIRDVERDRRDGVLAALDAACDEARTRRGVSIRKDVLNIDDPATCDAAAVAALVGACAAHGFQHQLMVSRAYHDSLFMSRIAPTAMLFIPCRNGYSHRPEEYASAEAIAAGALVLAEALASLSSAL